MKYFGSIDQGTTSSRFIVFNEKGNIVTHHQEELNQHIPNVVSVNENLQSLVTITTSPVVIRPRPPAIAAPSTDMMTGFG